MIIAASILPLNAPLNYALIYGKFGLPELGGVGCGYATAIVFWVELGFMTLFLRKPYFRATRFFAVFERPQWTTIGKIFVRFSHCPYSLSGNGAVRCHWFLCCKDQRY